MWKLFLIKNGDYMFLYHCNRFFSSVPVEDLAVVSSLTKLERERSERPS